MKTHHFIFYMLTFLIFIIINNKEVILENFIIQDSDLNYGTGFFINPNHLISNEHVVSDCKQIKIIEPKYQKQYIDLIDKDKNLDLAIFKAQKDSQYFAVLDPRKKINTKEQSFTIGYPFRKYNFNSGNVITSPYLDKSNNTFKILYSNEVNVGNSGGALLNNKLSVIGVIDAYITDSIKKVGSAVHLEHLKKFVQKNNVEYFINNNQKEFNSREIEEYAKLFTVKIRCIKK